MENTESRWFTDLPADERKKVAARGAAYLLASYNVDPTELSREGDPTEIAIGKLLEEPGSVEPQSAALALERLSEYQNPKRIAMIGNWGGALLAALATTSALLRVALEVSAASRTAASFLVIGCLLIVAGLVLLAWESEAARRRHRERLRRDTEIQRVLLKALKS